jgi:hypothetical protein
MAAGAGTSAGAGLGTGGEIGAGMNVRHGAAGADIVSFRFSASVGGVSAFSSLENSHTSVKIAAPPIKSTGATAARVEPAAISGTVCFAFIFFIGLNLK